MEEGMWVEDEIPGDPVMTKTDNNVELERTLGCLSMRVTVQVLHVEKNGDTIFDNVLEHENKLVRQLTQRIRQILAEN
jgi:hypothetical protein